MKYWVLNVAVLCLVAPSWAAMEGIYSIGAAGDFATIQNALDSLVVQGLSGNAQFKIDPGNYAGPLFLGSVPGAGQFSIEFTVNDEGWADLVTTNSQSPAMVVDHGSAILVERFRIVSPGGAQPSLRITGTSAELMFRDCEFTGTSGGNVIELTGPECQSVSFDTCVIRRGARGISATAEIGSANGLRIERCLIDSVNCGVYLSHQTSVLIRGCDIRANTVSSGGASGVWVSGQLATDSVQIIGNRIHDFRASAGYACAIRHEPWSAAKLFAANNLIYGFNNSGSSQVRAILFSSGNSRVVNNSIYVNDVAATGSVYTIYDGLTSSSYSLELLNNILFNAEATRPAYNLFMLTQAAPLVSEHNIFHGSGADYAAAWMMAEYASLSSWQAASGLDAHSQSGDPQFTSVSDLHMQASSSLAHQNGAVALDVAEDFDGQARHQPPDIGADEYDFAAPSIDAKILDVIGLCPSIPEQSLVSIRAVVQNRGTLMLTNVPVRITLGGGVLTETLVTLPPSHADTVLIAWSTGAAQDSVLISVEILPDGDANPSDNSHVCTITITGPPLSGTYRVGGLGADFLTISEATLELQQRGMIGDVSLEIAAGLYPEPLALSAIPGSDAHALTIRRAIDAEGPVRLIATSGQQMIRLSGVSHVTLEGLDLEGGVNTLEAVRLDSGASFNTIRNCNLLCSSLEQSSAAGLYVLGGCAGNLFENLSVSNSYYGIRLEGNAPQSDSGNVVRSCSIQNVRTGLYVARQRACLIENCAIAAGFENAPANCYAIRVGALTAQDTVKITRNRILGGQSSGTLYGLSSSAGAGAVIIDNSFFGNWTLTGSGYLYGLHVLSGQVYSVFNSFDLNDISGSATVIGVYGGGASAMLHLHNSILRVAESQNPAYALLLPSGTIHSDYNLYESASENPNFALGRIGANTYATLSSWQTATTLDSNSVSGAAGFVSASDLHVRPDATGASSHGLFMAEFPEDIDGEVRDTLPDLGADEYVHVAAVVDAVCSSLGIPPLPMQSGSVHTISGGVRNAGTIAIPEALVTLYFNGLSLGERVISVAPGGDVECSWIFNAPVTDLSTGALTLAVIASGDAVPHNNELTQSVVIAGAPLSGNASISPLDGQFATPNELLEHLRWRGVEGEFVATVQGGDYNGPFDLSEIPYADAQSRVILLPATSSDTVIFHAEGAVAALRFLGADRVEVRDIFVRNDLNSAAAISFEQSSSENRLVNCTVEGAFPSDVASIGIRIGERCDGNLIDSCRVSGFYTGILMTSDSAQNSIGNRIAHSTVSGARFCVWADHQEGAAVAHCDLQPGYADGLASSCYGVYAVQLGEAGSLRVEGNRIHGFLDAAGPSTNRACGIYSAPGGDNSVEIVNNFIYDFSAVAVNKVRGIYLATGANLVANNSIRLDNVPSTNDVCGIYFLTGVLHECYNNCVVCYENTSTSSALYFASTGDAIADYNCYWGSSPLFSVAKVDTHTYAELVNWQATGNDAHGNDAYPHYVSSTDLHIETDNAVLYRAGISLPQVTDDIDDEPRLDPPCIGADEYVYHVDLPDPDSLVVLASTNSIRLIWTSVAGAAGYQVFTATTLSELDSLPTLYMQTPDTLLDIDLTGDSELMRFYRVETVEP
ncbi:right-handed parallel beta-helix repeat-containing protein [bacterium]|nr:right-handed parallel beta-helix repeat-containing protein [bacterium]